MMRSRLPEIQSESEGGRAGKGSAKRLRRVARGALALKAATENDHVVESESGSIPSASFARMLLYSAGSIGAGTFDAFNNFVLPPILQSFGKSPDRPAVQHAQHRRCAHPAQHWCDLGPSSDSSWAATSLHAGGNSTLRVLLPSCRRST